jgi:molybdopterin converting factor subunit 1
MTIRVKFFAVLYEAAGLRAVSLELPAGTCVRDAVAELCRQYPAMTTIRDRFATAVNMTYVPRDHLLNDGDELALIPPVSGG